MSGSRDANDGHDDVAGANAPVDASNTSIETRRFDPDTAESTRSDTAVYSQTSATTSRTPSVEELPTLAQRGGRANATDPDGSMAVTSLSEESWTTLSRRRKEEAAPRVYLNPGEVINGRYTVREVLGEGGMGVVYRVTDELHPDREVALKTIQSGTLDDDQLALFKAEFATMTKLRHPNVARVYDFEATGEIGEYLFTLEYVPGQDIYRASEGKGWRDVTDLLVQTCRALAYIHSREVVHFDLKPANVLVTGEGQVKVLDFGIAGTRAMEGGTHAMGTPSYMAPEMAQGDALDHRADLYCMGIMAYQLLCRRLPFQADTLVGLLFHHCYTPVEFDEEARARVPTWLRVVVERLCAKEAAERYRTGNAVIEGINRLGGLEYELETQETRESYILSSRFVGRDTELARITRFYEARTEGSERLSPAQFVGGQSGIGKSRLMREVRHRAQLAQVPFFVGNCYEGALAELAPIAEVLGYVVRLARAAEAEHLVYRHAAALGKIDPALVGAEEPASEDGEGEDEGERVHLMDQISEFLVQVARVQPYILYFNDLHWGQAAAVEMVGTLLRRIAIQETRGDALPLTVLGTYRDDEIEGRPMEDLLDGLQRRGACEVLLLEPLEGGDVDLLLGSMLGLEAIPDAFVERVNRETAGNPYFVEEVMRELVENGSVFLEAGQWAAREKIVDLDIPVTITNVFLRRLALLDEDQRRLLERMATYGRPVPARVVAEVSGIDVEQLHGRLRPLSRRQIIQRVSGDELTYRVSHDRMRETLYEEIEGDRRKDIHLRLARALLACYPDAQQTHLYEVADHFFHAGQDTEALTYSVTAGDRAKEAYENNLAVELYQRAMSLLPVSEARQRLELTEKLADLYMLTARYPDSQSHYRSVLEATSDSLGQARLQRKIGRVYWQTGDMARAIDHLWDAIELLGGRRTQRKVWFYLALAASLCVYGLRRIFPFLARREKDPARRTRLRHLCATYLGLGDAYFIHEPASILLPAVVTSNLVDRIGESREMVETYCNAGVLYLMMTRYDTGNDLLDRAVEVADTLDSPWHAATAAAHRSYGHLFMSEFDRAVALSRQAREAFLVRGDESQLTFSCACEFFALMYQGNAREAARLTADVLETLEIREQDDSMKLAAGLLSQLGWANALLGRDELALTQLERSLQLLEEVADPFPLAHGQMEAGHSMLVMGAVDKAIEFLELARATKESNALFFDTLEWTYPMLARAYLVRLRAAGSDAPRWRRKASKAVRKGLKLVKRHSNYAPAALLNQGLLDWAEGRREDAVAAFDRSIDTARRQGSFLMLAETHMEAGRCWVEDDPKRARRHLQLALDLFDDRGMEPHAQQCRALIDEAGGSTGDAAAP